MNSLEKKVFGALSLVSLSGCVEDIIYVSDPVNYDVFSLISMKEEISYRFKDYSILRISEKMKILGEDIVVKRYERPTGYDDNLICYEERNEEKCLSEKAYRDRRMRIVNEAVAKAEASRNKEFFHF